MADHSSLPSVNNVKARFEQMAAAESVELSQRRVSHSVTTQVDTQTREVAPDSIIPTTVPSPAPKKQPPGAPPKPARLSSLHGRSHSIAQASEKTNFTPTNSVSNPPSVLSPAPTTVVYATPTPTHAPTPIPTPPLPLPRISVAQTPLSEDIAPPSSLMPPPSSRIRDRSITPPVPPPPRIKTPVDGNKSPVWDSIRASRSPSQTPPQPPLSRTPISGSTVTSTLNTPPINGLGLRSPQPAPSNPPMLPPRPTPIHQNSNEGLVNNHQHTHHNYQQGINHSLSDAATPHNHQLPELPHHTNFSNQPSSSYPNLQLGQPKLLSPPILPPRPVRSASPHDPTIAGRLPPAVLTLPAPSTPSVPTVPPAPTINSHEEDKLTAISTFPPTTISGGLQSYPPPPIPTPVIPEQDSIPNDIDDESYDSIYSNPNDSSSNLISSSSPSEYTYYGCPDSSQASRRPPIFEGVLHSIQLSSSSKGESKKTVSTFGKNAFFSGGSSSSIYDTQTGEQIWCLNHSDTRITSIGYKSDDGQVFWLGTKDGQLWEIRLSDMPASITTKRTNTHLTPLVLIHRNEETNEMWTLSEDGKICVWSNCDMSGTPKTFRVTPNFKAFGVAGSTLWIGRNRQIFVYQPSSLSNVPFLLTARPITVTAPANIPPPIQPSPSSASLSGMNGYVNGTTSGPLPSSSNLIGELTCAAYLSNVPDSIFFGHDNGCISIYSISQLSFIETINVSMHKVCSMCGVGNYLWIGLKNGTILVCDATTTPWTIRKEWKAHDSAVVTIECFDDLDLSQVEGMLPVISSSLTEGSVALWDGLLKHDWIGK